MLFISKAHAQSVEISADAAGSAAAQQAPGIAAGFGANMAMVLAMIVLFYFLMIRPQQKRFKEHSDMLAALKQGDKVLTSGGLIGKIEKLTEGSDEVIVALDGGTKVTALRSTLMKREETPKAKATSKK